MSTLITIERLRAAIDREPEGSDCLDFALWVSRSMARQLLQDMNQSNIVYRHQIKWTKIGACNPYGTLTQGGEWLLDG